MDARIDGLTADVVVVGGGLAGLAAAATVGRAGRSVVLVDGQGGGGGRAATEAVGRYRFNRGAHALYNRGAGRKVLSDLGVKVSGAAPPVRGAQGRLGDRTGLLPVGAVSMARTSLLSRRDKVVLGKLLATVGRWRPERHADLTASQWFDQLELEGGARQTVEMLTRVSTYSADFDIVAADVVASQLQSAIAGGVEYLHQGWGTLVAGLAEAGRRTGVQTLLRTPVRRVVPEGGQVRVDLEDGVVHGRRVVLAVGSAAATAALLPGGAPGSWDGLGPAARTACLDLGMRDVPPTQLLFALDRPLYLSCHAPTAAGLAPRGAATVQLLRYLGVDEDPSKEETLVELGEHCRLASVDPATAEESRYLHRMVASSAQPTPSGGGLHGRPTVTGTGLDGVLVAGDWVGPEGYLADASLASAATAAHTAVTTLDHAPTTHPVAGTSA